MPDHDHLCEDCKRTLARYARENDTYREALEMIAGQRPCLDDLMSNAEIAQAALTLVKTRPVLTP